MEESNSKEVLNTKEATQEQLAQKKSLGQLFGIELSAPEGMKNPRSLFLLLVFGNLILLLLVGKALF